MLGFWGDHGMHLNSLMGNDANKARAAIAEFALSDLPPTLEKQIGSDFDREEELHMLEAYEEIVFNIGSKKPQLAAVAQQAARLFEDSSKRLQYWADKAPSLRTDQGAANPIQAFIETLPQGTRDASVLHVLKHWPTIKNDLVTRFTGSPEEQAAAAQRLTEKTRHEPIPVPEGVLQLTPAALLEKLVQQGKLDHAQYAKALELMDGVAEASTSPSAQQGRKSDVGFPSGAQMLWFQKLNQAPGGKKYHQLVELCVTSLKAAIPTGGPAGGEAGAEGQAATLPNDENTIRSSVRSALRDQLKAFNAAKDSR